MLGPQYSIIKALADLFVFIASAALNITLFGRVYFTFQLSYLAVSTYTIIFLSLQIITSIILSLGYCIVLIVEPDEGLADKYSGPLVVAIVFNDLTVSLSMLILFSFKLHQLVINMSILSRSKTTKEANYQKFMEASTTEKMSFPTGAIQSSLLKTKLVDSSFTHVDTNTKINEIDIHKSNPSQLSSTIPIIPIRKESNILDEHQLNTVVILTRHTILGGFAILFNQTYYGLDYISMQSLWENSYFYGILIYGIRMIGMIGVTVSIYFSMKWAKYMYFNCCACCHLFCFKCCLYVTTRKITKGI